MESKILQMETELKGFYTNYLCKKTMIYVFGLLASINLAFFGYTMAVISGLEAKVEANQAQFLRIETQLSQIQTDLLWIKKEINPK